MKEAVCWCVHCFNLITTEISQIGEHRPQISEAATKVTHFPNISLEAEWQ